METMQDLRRRTDLRASDYDMVQAAGLARRLLLDGGNSLAHKIKRNYKYQPHCSWGKLRVLVPARESPAWIPLLWLDPILYQLRFDVLLVQADDSSYETPPPREGTLDEFMRSPAIIRGDSTVSVQDIIKYYANREGGVHHDETPAKNELLADVRADSEEALRLTVLAAARIVHRALEPLAVLVHLVGKPHPAGLRLREAVRFD